MSDTGEWISDRSDTEEEFSAIVIKNGSCNLHAGFAGDDAPRLVMPNVVGTSRRYYDVRAARNPHCYVGDQALTSKGPHQLSCCWPVEYGVVQDWDKMEEVWRYTFEDDLRAPPSDHGVLLLESPMNPRADRERTAEIMFEHHQARHLHLVPEQPVALLSFG